MRVHESDTCVAEPRPATLRLMATDVTGSLELSQDVQTDVPAGAVARSLAEQMELPKDVAWALRNDAGAFLDEDRQISEQVQEGEILTITPKSHLG